MKKTNKKIALGVKRLLNKLNLKKRLQNWLENKLEEWSSKGEKYVEDKLSEFFRKHDIEPNDRIMKELARYGSCLKEARGYNDFASDAEKQWRETYRNVEKFVSVFNNIADDLDKIRTVDKDGLEELCDVLDKLAKQCVGMKADLEEMSFLCKKLKIWIPKAAFINNNLDLKNLNERKIAKQILKIAKQMIN